jgi:hypothetical protein
MLILGLALFGIGDGLLVMSGLGVSPWTVLAQGLSVRLPLTIGAATLLVSTLVADPVDTAARAARTPRTISNIIVIASALQVTVVAGAAGPGGSHPDPASIDAYRDASRSDRPHRPRQRPGLHLQPRPGPRDGWMTGFTSAPAGPLPGCGWASRSSCSPLVPRCSAARSARHPGLRRAYRPVGRERRLAGRIGRVPGLLLFEVADADFPKPGRRRGPEAGSGRRRLARHPGDAGRLDVLRSPPPGWSATASTTTCGLTPALEVIRATSRCCSA